jgi:AcrR family transcriptional regulator
MTAPRRRKAEPAPAARPSRQERRQLLLAHAKRLVAEQGVRAATPEQVAAAAGVGVEVLLRHFPDPEALLAGVLDAVGQSALKRWQEETVAPADPLARLHALVECFLKSAAAYPEDFRVVHLALLEVRQDGPLAAQLRGMYGQAEALLAGVIAQGQQTGVFRRSLDPRVGAAELIGAALGHTLIMPLAVPLHAEHDYPARAVECLLHGLLKTDV